MSEPPPTPVRPTTGRAPRPVSVNCQVTTTGNRVREEREHAVGGVLDVELGHVETEVRLLGRLVRRVDAGEVASSPVRAFAYRPGRVALGGELPEVDEHLDELVLVEQRAGRPRSAAERETKGGEHDQPASVISFATSPALRLFSARSASVKLRSFEMPRRRFAPSSRTVWRPRRRAVLERVRDRRLPAPGSPVSQTTNGRCALSPARASRSTSSPSSGRSRCAARARAARRRPCGSVIRSMRMKPPVSRFSTYGSNATGGRARLATPISFRSSCWRRSARACRRRACTGSARRWPARCSSRPASGTCARGAAAPRPSRRPSPRTAWRPRRGSSAARSGRRG